MNTKKTTRWNGKIEALSAAYLKDVMDQMLAYGDRVQFALNCGGQRPHYQVMNASAKKMAFDSNHHLLHPAADDFVGSTASGVYTLDQIKTAMAGGGTKSASATGARTSRVGTGSGSRSGSSRTTAAKKADLVDAEKYEYFKNNRLTLPSDIREHTHEITALMHNGKSAEEAFSEVIKNHF